MRLLLSSDAFPARARVQAKALVNRRVVFPGERLRTVGSPVRKWAESGQIYLGTVKSVLSKDQADHEKCPEAEADKYLYVHFDNDEDLWFKRPVVAQHLVQPEQQHGQVKQRHTLICCLERICVSFFLSSILFVIFFHCLRLSAQDRMPRLNFT